MAGFGGVLMNLKFAYWTSTGLLCAVYLASTTMYVSDLAGVQATFGLLGYPGYLVVLLIVAVLAILSRRSVALSDLAYAGMFFHLSLAASAHLGAGDPLLAAAPAGVAVLLLLVSFLTQNAGRAKPSPYGSVAAITAMR